MRIGELARAVGCSTRMIRYYEQHGLLQAGRGENGYRSYDQDAVPRLRNIRKLIAIGLTTDDVRAILPHVVGELPETFDDSPACADGRAIAQSRLADLDERLRDSQVARDRLAGRLGQVQRAAG